MNAKLTRQKKFKSVASKTNWTKVKTLTEKEIVSAARSDSDAKLLTKAELKKFTRVNPPHEVSVKAIRKTLNVSQEDFANYFGVGKRTIQEWEQGRRTPTTTARILLSVIAKEPKVVQRVLSNQHHSL